MFRNGNGWGATARTSPEIYAELNGAVSGNYQLSIADCSAVSDRVTRSTSNFPKTPISNHQSGLQIFNFFWFSDIYIQEVFFEFLFSNYGSATMTTSYKASFCFGVINLSPLFHTRPVHGCGNSGQIGTKENDQAERVISILVLNFLHSSTYTGDLSTW